MIEWFWPKQRTIIEETERMLHIQTVKVVDKYLRQSAWFQVKTGFIEYSVNRILNINVCLIACK
jgi:glycerol-3-phosphate cytidylyltransferase-like family protein